MPYLGSEEPEAFPENDNQGTKYISYIRGCFGQHSGTSMVGCIRSIFSHSSCTEHRFIKKSLNVSVHGKVSTVEKWSIPPIRDDEHVSVRLSRSSEDYFTAAQPMKLHRRFAHPSASKLYTRLKKACPEETRHAAFNAPEKLTSGCVECLCCQTCFEKGFVELANQQWVEHFWIMTLRHLLQ